MKRVFFIFAILAFAIHAPGQTNEPVKLALISESGEASSASDILTAELSKNNNIQLLERDEIEKVYREQGMSAANRDDLKLGRILGAEGLLLFDIVRTSQATNLTARLIAVKPGVILTDGSFTWPLKNNIQWAESVSTYLNSYLAKLSLAPKDAIPISVVNLRSAISSAGGAEVEQQLKLLTIQRLSQERQLFVLERQKMQLLSEEKQLKADESAFWSGSYLLEGVVDQNGYSTETVTINGRLTPPKGSAPLLFEVIGSRTNLPEVVNQLAAKVIELLKINSSVPGWKTADEAAQYFDEAKWALRWGMFSEAQAAAESAWALGKQDLGCAELRIESYLPEISAHLTTYNHCESDLDPVGGYSSENKPLGPPPSDAVVQQDIDKTTSRHPFGIVWKVRTENGAKAIEYAFADGTPDAVNINRARHALELYLNYSRLAFPYGSKDYSELQSSEWYPLGIEDLTCASEVLREFNFAQGSEKPLSEQLSELRALARTVAVWMSKSPPIHDGYFVGDRVAVYDELDHFGVQSSIFSCEVDWGCYWQETLEDGVALYRELMNSPVFCYIHKDFWSRELLAPRLVAWNDQDRKRIPLVWNNFVQELGYSTNVLWQLEAKALQLADASNDAAMAEAFTNLFSSIIGNRAVLVSNNVDVLYLGWHTQDFVENLGGGISSDTKDSLRQIYYSDYIRKLQAMDQEYRNNADQLIRANHFQAAFEYQKKYLQQNKPYVFFEFVRAFQNKDYSEPQALEIQPLIAAYKSNLVAQILTSSGIQRSRLQGAAAVVGSLENDVNHVLFSSGPKAFERQKQYLSANSPFDPEGFLQMFLHGFKDYSKAQALEIQPLLAAYKSNLVAQTLGQPPKKVNTAKIGIMMIGQMEANVSFVLNPPAPRPQPQMQPQPPRPAATVKTVAVVPASNIAPEVATNILTVNKFLEIPLDGLPGDQISGIHITAHHWVEGKLVLDFQYGALLYSFDAKGAWQQTRSVMLPAIAILDPATEHWDVIECPEVDVGGENRFYHRTTLWHGELFTSDGGQVKKYDFPSQQWQVLPVSDGANYELFTVNDCLYAANRNIIFEILDGGKSTDILASARRQPPVSALDTQDLGTPTLFEGPNHSLRVCTQSKILTWVGNEWREDCAAPPASFPPAISTDAVLFRTDGFNEPAKIFNLSADTNGVQFCLGQKAHPVNYAGFYRPSVNTPTQPKPLWMLPSDLFLANLPAAALQSDVCLLVNHSETQEIANDQHDVVQEKVVAKDGYNAALLCFSGGLPLPQKLFLKFDAPNGCPPAAGIDPGSQNFFPSQPPGWMLFTTNFLFLGLELSRDPLTAFNGADRIGIGYKTGVWLMPVSQIEPAIAAQKQIQIAQKAQDEAKASAAAAQVKKQQDQMKEFLLAKYDHNHNGVIDPEEKEEALDDPAFIESELDVIDPSHNGWLDAAELAYFDANTNKILEPKEQAGIEIAQHLLAERLLKKFDVNSKGWLDREEFNELQQASGLTHPRTVPAYVNPSWGPFPGGNHDDHVDAGKLETFLNEQTRSELRSRGMQGAALFHQFNRDPNQPIDPRQLFKAAVEAYWQHPGAKTGHDPANQ